MNDFDWFAYAEQAQDNFIERFADLDVNEHPEKVAEIFEAQRMREERQRYVIAMNKIIDELKQAMREEENAPMHYLLPLRIKQILLDGVPGCALSMGADGNVVFTESDGSQVSLSTVYRDKETRERIMQEHLA